ncbi:transposase-like protein%2C ISSpn_AP200_1 [Streptococcus pneumoniae]|nr:transposase-like protein%2C ISSpn_AP200_1 [Streptococcus pneumoniae]
MLYVGIDVAKNKHDVTALNVPGKTVLKPLTFSNNKAGFELFQEHTPTHKYVISLNKPAKLTNVQKLMEKYKHG